MCPHPPTTPFPRAAREAMREDKDGGTSAPPLLSGSGGPAAAERQKAEARDAPRRWGTGRRKRAGPPRPAAGLRPPAAALLRRPGQTER